MKEGEEVFLCINKAKTESSVPPQAQPPQVMDQLKTSLTSAPTLILLDPSLSY